MLIVGIRSFVPVSTAGGQGAQWLRYHSERRAHRIHAEMGRSTLDVVVAIAVAAPVTRKRKTAAWTRPSVGFETVDTVKETLMRQIWIMVLCMSSAAVTFANAVPAWSAEQITCTGKIVNEQGQPIAGVEVKLYRVAVETESLSYKLGLAQERTTEADGTFALKTEGGGDEYSGQAIILAGKEGLALGWANWRLQADSEVEIALGPPTVLAGTVVDEAGNPISDADVGISFMLVQAGGQPRYLVGDMSLELLTAKSDAEGKFSFNRIPAAASAEFLIKKSGRATISTFDPQNFQGGSLQYTGGQTDIKITQPLGATIEGVVVEKVGGKPVGGMRIMALRGRNQPTFGLEPVVSRENGTFSIGGLAPGQHLLQVVSPPGETTAWIAGPVEVLTEAGKTQGGVKVEVTKGGVLEVLVTDSVSGQPVEGATVSVQPAGGGTGSGNRTDKAGIAQVRLAPGEYEIAYLHKQGYSRQRLPQDTITVEDGKTVRVEQELTSLPKITGVVRDDQGRLVAGARIKVCPWGQGETTSDSEGRFEVRRDAPNRAPSVVPYVVARHFERNLAAAVEIGEDQKVVDVNMTTGVTCAGKVVDVDGKPIENARVYLTFWSSGHGSSMAHQEKTTDADGYYEIKAVPRHYRYSVNAGAEGYGQDYVHISPEDARDRFMVETISLATADLSISGIVVDSEGKPVDNAQVSCQGRGQPHRRTQTDENGQFTLESVCAGKITISSYKSVGEYLYGRTETEGGAGDVRVVISQRPTSTRYEPKRPPSLIGEPLPDSKALGAGLLPGDTEGKRLLVCFWDMQQRPSRHCLTQLAKQAEMLKDKGVIVVAVQASKMDQKALDEWVKTYKIPFPVGMVQSSFEKARFSWGIRSLPWLILTDRTHIIRAAGFRVNELSEKIREMTDGKP